jgi:tryptophanyl-tRNA synthetase
MQEPQINPWSSNQSVDVEKLFSDFGIEPIAPIIPDLPNVPYFMRRGIVVGHRDYRPIASAIRNCTPFHILTGFMPSGHPHLGHLMVMKEVVCLYALGFEGQTYFQSKNERLKDLAFEAATKVNFSELTAIYGFSPETDLAHADSVITQVADILYPQIDREPAPTVVPVGIDQDPHIRLTRGVAHKLRMFTVEERHGSISVRSKNAPEKAFDAVKAAFPHAKKYVGHVDIKGAQCSDVSAKVRQIERAHGGFAFYTPSSTYHIFMPGLTGGKMSSSIPESIISFYEPEATVRKKVISGITGGRMTLEEQKRLGGEPDRCSLYLLNLFHMVTDDAELAEIRRKCVSGEIMCGNCKKETAERVVAFLKDFKEKMDAAADKIEV